MKSNPKKKTAKRPVKATGKATNGLKVRKHAGKASKKAASAAPAKALQTSKKARLAKKAKGSYKILSGEGRKTSPLYRQVGHYINIKLHDAARKRLKAEGRHFSELIDCLLGDWLKAKEPKAAPPPPAKSKKKKIIAAIRVRPVKRPAAAAATSSEAPPAAIAAAPPSDIAINE